MADQTISRLKTKLTSEIFSKFGDNSKYVFMPLKIDETLITKFNNIPDKDIAKDIFDKVQSFKNLSFFKKNQSSEKIDADRENQNILTFVNSAVTYL
jgi:hypothetical protein